MELAIRAVCQALLNAESKLTDLDRAVGDGDLGINLARAARAVDAALPEYPLDDPRESLKALAFTLQETLGGSSGPLYGVLLLRFSNSLENQDIGDPKSWAKAAIEASHAVSELGGAVPGDRTMLDALTPFANAFHASLEEGLSWRDAIQIAATEAERAAEATAQMIPRRGRASYLGKRALGSPDPGAIAVAIWLRALSSLHMAMPTRGLVQERM